MGDVERCGYAVTDLDGEQQPCDRVATGWRWYQDCEHEDTLERACDWHANEGGRRLHEAEAKVARVEALIEEREAWARAKTAELKARWADRPEPVRRRYGISAVYGTAELRVALTEEA